MLFILILILIKAMRANITADDLKRNLQKSQDQEKEKEKEKESEETRNRLERNRKDFELQQEMTRELLAD